MPGNPYHYDGFLTREDKIRLSNTTGGVVNYTEGPPIMGYNPSLVISESGNVTTITETLPTGQILVQTIDYSTSGQTVISKQYQLS